ncbi:conserved exported protein of unknown function [Nitratireductor aquimarinus]
MKLKLAFAATLYIQSSICSAQSNAEVVRALNNVQHEMSTCIAYNTIVASCIRSQDPTTADAYDAAAEHLLLVSNRIGQTIGMSQDAMNSRMTLEWSQMNKLIGQNCVNISSLTSRHAFRCKEVVENGDGILAEHLNTQ